MKKEKRIDISALEKDAPKHAGATALRMLRAMKNQRARLIAVAICVLAYTFFTIFTPYYSAIVVDSLVAAINDAIAAGTPFAIAWMPLGRQMTILFAMYIILATVYYLQSFLMASVAENLILTLRKRISEKLHKLPLKFFDGNQPGEVLSRVTSDLDKVSETMQTGLLKLMTSVGTLIGAVAFMFAINWLLALIFVADALVSFIITKFVAKKNLICASVRQETLSRLTAAAEEHYTGRDVIKAYNREESSSAVLGERTERLRTASRDADFLTGRAGLVIGKKFNYGTVDDLDRRYFQIGLIGGVNHEFLGDQEIWFIGTDGASAKVDGHGLGGTSFYYGLTADWQVSDRVRFYAELDREEGDHYTKDYGVNVGFKYSFE